MTSTDVVYIWGRYEDVPNPVNFYPSPTLVDNLGTGGSPTPIGAVQSIDCEASWFIAIVAGLPYGVGDNSYNSISQTSNPFYGSQQLTGLGATTGKGASWFATGAGVTLPILQCDGGNHGTWAVDSAGAVWAWGNAANGMLGNNNTSDNGVAPASQPIPAQVYAVGHPAGDAFLTLKAAYGSVTSGQTHAVGLLSTGKVVACGTDQHGECGDGISLPTSESGHPANYPYNAIPVNVLTGAQGDASGLLSDITAISAGNHHTLALDSSGNVWAWGYNLFGQLGNDSDIGSSVPVAPQWPAGADGPTFPIVAISGGGGYVNTDGQSFAIDSAGVLWVWGANSFGQLGLGTPGNENFGSPQAVPIKAGINSMLPPGVTIVQASSGTRHGMALDSSGILWVWGDNSYGELGIPSIQNPIPGEPGSVGTSIPTQINAGALATLPTAGVVNLIWAGNGTSMVDISVVPPTIDPASTFYGPGAMAVA